MADRPTLVPFRAEDVLPKEFVERLTHALECAQDGTLKECIFSYTVDDPDGPIHEDGSRLLTGGHFFWRSDGRLDAVHSHLGVLEHMALRELVDDE